MSMPLNERQWLQRFYYLLYTYVNRERMHNVAPCNRNIAIAPVNAFNRLSETSLSEWVNILFASKVKINTEKPQKINHKKKLINKFLLTGICIDARASTEISQFH